MQQICPACQAENRDSALYCEQCGGSLAGKTDAEPVAAAAPKRSATVNWAALAALVLVVGAVTWVVAMPTKPADGVGAGGGNPHAEAANPHGEGNPHAEGAGMGDIAQKLEDGKARLEKNPLDVEALTSLYDLYGEIGMGEKMRPYAEAAVAAWKKANQEGEPDLKTLAGVGMATIKNGDHFGSTVVMEAYHAAEPGNLGIVVTLGNLNFEISREFAANGDQTGARKHAQAAIAWYDKYLIAATPAEQGNDFWNARVDQASMRLDLSDTSGKSEAYRQALSSLLEVTKRAPDNWGGWHNLGLAYKLTDQKAEAVAALQQAEKVAAGELNRWESQKEIALLEGKTPPPSPVPESDPHAGVDMPDTPEGMPNPHGEGGGFNPHGESANPHAEGNSQGKSDS